MALDFSPASQDALSLLVYQYNLTQPLTSHQLNLEDFAFDAPIPNPNPDYPANTLLRARALASSGKYGVVSLYYNRMDLADLPAYPLYPREVSFTFDTLIADVNDYYGIRLLTSDYEPLPFDHLNESYALTATPDSLLFIGVKVLTWNAL